MDRRVILEECSSNVAGLWIGSHSRCCWRCPKRETESTGNRIEPGALVGVPPAHVARGLQRLIKTSNKCLIFVLYLRRERFLGASSHTTLTHQEAPALHAACCSGSSNGFPSWVDDGA